jgi:hypothetical protein
VILQIVCWIASWGKTKCRCSYPCFKWKIWWRCIEGKSCMLCLLNLQTRKINRFDMVMYKVSFCSNSKWSAYGYHGEASVRCPFLLREFWIGIYIFPPQDKWKKIMVLQILPIIFREHIYGNVVCFRNIWNSVDNLNTGSSCDLLEPGESWFFFLY